MNETDITTFRDLLADINAGFPGSCWRVPVRGIISSGMKDRSHLNFPVRASIASRLPGGATE